MLSATTPTFLASLSAAARGGVYAAAAGAMIALTVAQSGGPEGLSPQQGAVTLTVVALLGSRVYAEARRSEQEKRKKGDGDVK